MTKRFGSSLPRPEPEGNVVGAVIADKYRLERLLGEGGGGSVWHATNLQLETPVAIKLLRGGPTRRELGERLRVEARAAARLVHPSIVRVFDIGEANPDEPFIVMELLSGESLSDRIHRLRPRAIEAVQLLLPIAEALTVAHAAGVIHRDLKPDNVILCDEGEFVRPKLLDFGVAKISTGNGQRKNITQRGALVGSPSYMSPEQARASEHIDHRSDIWSFCVVLYETLSGMLPFDGPDGGALLRAVIKEPPRPLTRVPGVDRQLWSLIEQGLNKLPNLRPSSMLEVGRELARWLRRHGVTHDAAGTPLDARWLPRTGLAVPAPRAAGNDVGLGVARTVDLVPLVPSFTGAAGGSRRPAPAEPSTFRPVLHPEPRRPARKAGRRAKKAKDDQWLVMCATSGTLLAVFLGIAWATGGFDEETRSVAASQADTPVAQSAPSLGAVGAFRGEPAPLASGAGAAAADPPGPPSNPGTAAPDPPGTASGAAPQAPVATPPRLAAPPPPPPPPALVAKPAQQAAAPKPAAAALLPAKPAAATRAPGPSLGSSLNTLSPPPPKRTEGRPPKARPDSADLLAPY